MEIADLIEHDHRPWWLRVRSGISLALLLVGLGVAAAALLGLGAVALMALFDRALG